MKATPKKTAKKKEAIPKGVASPSKNETISIREIGNGFIIRRTCDTKDGFEESEYYTEKRPDIELPKSTKAKG